MYILKCRETGGHYNSFGDFVEYPEKEVKCRFKKTMKIKLFFLKMLYDWVLIEEVEHGNRK